MLELNKMLHRSLNRPRMKKLIMARVPSLQSKEWVKFCPHDQEVSVNDFVAYIQILGSAFVVKRENHNRIIEKRRLTAQTRLPTTSTGNINPPRNATNRTLSILV